MDMTFPHLKIASNPECKADEHVIAGASVSGTLDKVHIASAATICFARSVNDTPKLAGLLAEAGFNVASRRALRQALRHACAPGQRQQPGPHPSAKTPP